MAKALHYRLVDKTKYAAVNLTRTEAQGTLSEQNFSQLIANPKDTVINCAGVADLTEQAIEQINILDQQLKASNKKLRLVFVGEPIKQALQKSKFGKPLAVLADPLAALVEFGALSPQISQTHFIKVLVNATLRAFYVQAETECRRREIFIKAEDKDAVLGDISGLVRVQGSGFQYAVFISFPEQTFNNLMTRMLGEKESSTDKRMRDGATEMLNIIFGQAKVVLNEQGADIRQELPTLHIGRPFAGLKFDSNPTKVVKLSEGKTIVVCFESDLGSFYIEAWFPAAFEAKQLRSEPTEKPKSSK